VPEKGVLMPDEIPISSANQSQPPRSKTAGVVVAYKPKWHQRVAAWIVFALIRLVWITLRCRWRDRSEYVYVPESGPVIYCVWHNRLTLCIPAYHTYAGQRKKTHGLAAMVSASRDGGFLSGILECFKVQPVRGSSSRRGPQALLELTTWAERGYDLALTPDGPRGPVYVVQEGVMQLAQLTGLPVVPFSFYAKWKICLKSWDRFQIPLPFSHCEMRLGKAVFVPREASDEQREQLRQQIETELRAITRD
jgi:lysophospholipid acyltransferase (LPLAT)-like uncharacterized protein